MDRKTEEKFAALYETHADSVFRQCYFRVGDRDIALDLMQEAFMRTWDYIQKGNLIENDKAFLFKVANNLIKDHWRKKKPILERDMEEGFLINIASTELGEDDRAEYELVLRAVDRIEPIYRDILILRYVEGYAVKEIAMELGISENNASVRINRALKKIKELLSDHHD